MKQKKTLILCVFISIVIAGCGSIRRVDEMNARGTINAGGYTWNIAVDSEGGNTVQTHGLPGMQAATDASNQLCKKYKRVAQYVSRKNLVITGLVKFNFNCVK